MERHRKGSCALRLRVSGEVFRAMFIEHAAPTAEELPAYRAVNSPIVPSRGSHPCHCTRHLHPCTLLTVACAPCVLQMPSSQRAAPPPSFHASQARLGVAKAVIAKSDATLPGRVAEALGNVYAEPYHPPSTASSDRASSDVAASPGNSSRSSGRTDGTPRFGPYVRAQMRSHAPRRRRSACTRVPIHHGHAAHSSRPVRCP